MRAELESIVDAPGGLSIVLQGPASRAGLPLVAHHLEHWRRLFPAAQIISVITSSDVLTGLPPGGGTIASMTCSDDTIAQAAAGVIAATADLVVVAPPASPLPPIKNDNPAANHVNLMIAGAKAGLAHATGRYVLRIRNDLLFQDRRFLSVYADDSGAERGRWAIFDARVLVPEIFTLNPFALSHMPFHYSDWCHFGRRADVAAIVEAAAPVTFADAIHYHAHPHRPGSNAVERRFHSRLAPEQSLIIPVIRRAFPALRLDQHNDMRDAEASIGVLADNFVLAGLAACGAHIPKYQKIVDRMSRYTRLECMSQTQLRRFLAERERPAADVFAAEARRADRIDSATGRDRWKARLRLPRVSWQR